MSPENTNLSSINLDVFLEKIFPLFHKHIVLPTAVMALIRLFSAENDRQFSLSEQS